MLAFKNAGKVATRVLPSPVFISEIFPSAKEMPPKSCESKCLSPKVRTLASLTAAYAIGSIE